MPYERRDNKFLWVKDFAVAQQLLDQQWQVHWPELLNGILKDEFNVRVATWLPRVLPRSIVVSAAASATGKMGLAS